MSAPTVGYYQVDAACAKTTSRRCANSTRFGTLKDFHDRVYKIGFLPVVLVREELFHDLEQEFGAT